MNALDYISHVDNSIAQALSGDVLIHEDIPKIKGFSTLTMRRLFAALCRLEKPDPVYLECGLYCGSTFCSAMCNNPNLTAIGIEDFSQPFDCDSVRQQLIYNLSKFRQDAKSVEVINSDCFTVDVSKLPKVDILFYDAIHDEWAQAKALPYFFEAMADTFIFICDDANWIPVFNGKNRGFEELKDRIKILKSWHLEGQRKQDDPIWWNGVDIHCIKKI